MFYWVFFLGISNRAAFWTAFVKYTQYPPFTLKVKNERQLSEQQARQEVLLTKGEWQIKHGGHTLVLQQTGKGWTL